MREADIRLITSDGGEAETIAVRGVCRIVGGIKQFSFRQGEAEFVLLFGTRVRIERKGDVAYTLILAPDGCSSAEIVTPCGTLRLEVRTVAQALEECGGRLDFRAEYELSAGAGEPLRREIIFTASCPAEDSRKRKSL